MVENNPPVFGRLANVARFLVSAASVLFLLPPSGHSESLTGRIIYNKYFAAITSTETAFVSVIRKPIGLDSGSYVVTSCTQFEVDGFRHNKTVYVSRNNSNEVIRETMTMDNRTGNWHLFPAIKTAVLLQPASAIHNFEKTAEDYHVYPDYSTAVQGGEACYVVKVKLPAPIQNKKKSASRDISIVDKLLHLFSDESEQTQTYTTTVHYLSQQTFLPLRSALLNDQGVASNEVVFDSVEITEKLNEEQYQVPQGYILKMPKTPEQLRQDMKACEFELRKLFHLKHFKP